MSSTRDDHRATRELVALALANPGRSPRVHRLAPRRPEPCVSPMVPPRQHTGCGRAQPDYCDRCQLRVIKTTRPGVTGQGVRPRECVGEAPREEREFSLPDPCRPSPRLKQGTWPNRDPARASRPPPVYPAIRALHPPGSASLPTRTQLHPVVPMTSTAREIGCPVPPPTDRR